VPGSLRSRPAGVPRAVCRRAERAIVALAMHENELVGEPALAYVNRLSDYLFVAARFANRRGEADVLWVPGANRGESPAPRTKAKAR